MQPTEPKSVDPSARPTPAGGAHPATAPRDDPHADPHANPHTDPHAGADADAEAQGASPGMQFQPEYGDTGDGLGVDVVRPGGAAEQAGIEAGDVIVKFAGFPITNIQDYMQALGKVKVGQEVEIVVRRDDQTKTLKGKVGVSAR